VFLGSFTELLNAPEAEFCPSSAGGGSPYGFFRISASIFDGARGGCQARLFQWI